MTLNLSMPGHEELKPRIAVFGVGGAGGNAVNNMIDKQLDGVEFVVANTDAQALAQSQAASRIQLGIEVTEGLGAGASATVGAEAAEESIEQIADHLAGAHMCFITAGLGGGTGTGAAPIIAQAARELGVLTVGVVTKPFQFEGAKRMRQAENGVDALQKVVDTLIIIPNQKLFCLANDKTTFAEAFSMVDDVLYQGVKGVTDLMVRPGLINLDFADVRAVMNEMGKAMMGTGEAEGESRATKAAEKAIANPLLDEISLRGAKGVLINITGGDDLTLFELDEAASRIRQEVEDADANIIFGSTFDTGMNGTMRVSVVATGIDAAEAVHDIPLPRRSMAAPLVKTVSVEEARREDSTLVETCEEPVAEKAAMVEAAEEPDPFERLEAGHAATGNLARDICEEPHEFAARESDDLPPPAYQPEIPPFEPHPDTLDAEPSRYVAPAGPAHGTVSEETMMRLRSAVEKSASAPTSPAEGVASRQPEQSRFGRLITRMTGQAADMPGNQTPKPMAPQTQPAMYQPNASSDAPKLEEGERERIEIPAFLRRQAN